MSLFRPEVVAARRGEWLGSVILMCPVSFTFLAAFAVLCASAIVALLCCGTYTKRARIAGVLVPDRGLLKIVPPQPGVIVEGRVKEGEAVQHGDVLFVLSSERLTSGDAGPPLATQAHGVTETTLHTVRARQKSLQEERGQRARLAAQQQDQLTQRLQNLEKEIAQIDRQITTQSKRARSAHSQYQTYEALHHRALLAPITLQQKQDEWLDQQSRLQALERDRLALDRERASTHSDLRQVAGKSTLEQAQITRALAELEQTGVTAAAQRQVLITAPQAGIVTAIHAEPGQTVTSQPLLTLLPANAVLEAQLYAPSRAAGFVEPGQHVRIRYAAYPYQKFGQYDGTVVSVSRIAIPPQELLSQLGHTVQSSGEALYRIHVALTAQTATVYGKPQPLTAGMLLEADVLQDTRTLLEWVFEPLYSFRGKV